MNDLALQVVDFSQRYPDGTSALEEINLEIRAGEALAVIGPNGAGKSTLLLCLAGLLQGQGEILIQGERVTSASAKKIRRRLALVFQDPDDQLFMPVLEEDVAFGPLNLGWDDEAVKRHVQTALQRVGLWDHRHRPPHHLSYGEKRRAALATALAMDPQILLLDEPTSNLDPATRRELIEYLGSLTITRVVATHDLDLASSLCSRCVLLSSGRAVAVGSTKDILADRALLNAHRLA